MTAPFIMQKIRLTATQGDLPLRWRVRRISVSLAVLTGLTCALPAAQPAKTSQELRILPATKLRPLAPLPATTAGPVGRPLAAAKPNAPPPLPAEPAPNGPAAPGGSGPRIVPNAPTSPTVPLAPGDFPSYEEVYQSIPYYWSEQMFNPSYRHEATMGILYMMRCR